MTLISKSLQLWLLHERFPLFKNVFRNIHCSNCKNIKTLSLFNSKTRKYVLGIETSCDDTGAAVVDDCGNIIGEALLSQTSEHNKIGGIVPNTAKEIHAKMVSSIVSQALDDSNMRINDVDAIAVTTHPGLIMSLREGMRHAVRLANMSGKPLIPIHHMQAHALTARMIHKVDFPYLVLLASGGHCLLAVARDIDDFLVLGSTIDIAPGDAIDKVARHLRLHHLPQFKNVCYGVMLEEMAKEGDPAAYPTINVGIRGGGCNFSFSGIPSHAYRISSQNDDFGGLSESEVPSNAADVSAWFQHSLVRHIARRVQRALAFCYEKDLLPLEPTLVISGGVASNAFLRSSLKKVCMQYGSHMICPPVKLCTDNGIMIAWNGMEKLLSGRNFFEDTETIDVQSRCPLGEDYSKQVSECKIKLPKLDLLETDPKHQTILR